MRRLLPPKTLETLTWLAGALLVAVFSWIVATTEENPVEVNTFPARIPIQVIHDDNMLIIDQSTTDSEVILRTQASVWEVLEADDIIVRADLSGFEPGAYIVELSVEIVEERRVVVEDWSPRQISIEIDTAAEILVPIVEDIRSDPPIGFEITAITFQTTEVLVTGPAAEVERVVTAQAGLRLGDERNPLTTDIRLIAVDNQERAVTGVTLEPEIVSVTVNIQPLADYREVFVTPNIVGEPPPGYVVTSITYDPQTIPVRGRPRALEQLPGSVLTNPIDLTDQTQGFSRSVPVILPDNVLAEQNITVVVEIGALPGSRNFEDLPVQIQGLDPELEALVSPENVSLFITGPAPILDTLTLDNITIVADLADLEVGSHQVPVQTIINLEGLEEATTSALPAVLDVIITARNPTPTPTSTPPLPTPIETTQVMTPTATANNSNAPQE